MLCGQSVAFMAEFTMTQIDSFSYTLVYLLGLAGLDDHVFSAWSFSHHYLISASLHTSAEQA